MRVQFSEGLKEMDWRSILSLTGTDSLEDIWFLMYFDPSNGKILVTGYPTKLKMGHKKSSAQFEVVRCLPEYALLFSGIEPGRVEPIYRRLEGVMSKGFAWDQVSSELERNLLVKKSDTYSMVSDNGLFILSKCPVCLEYNGIYSTKEIPADSAPQEDARKRWDSRF